MNILDYEYVTGFWKSNAIPEQPKKKPWININVYTYKIKNRPINWYYICTYLDVSRVA